MATYSSPTDVVAGSLGRASSLNAVDAATATAFELLPTNANINHGTINFALDTGVTDAYVVTLPHTPTGLVNGLHVVMLPLNSNTGACTINVSSLGVKSIRRMDSSVAQAADIRVGVPVDLRYSTVTGYFHLSPALSTTFTGSVTVVNGGTSRTTLTLNGVLYGNGTEAVGMTAIGAEGQILRVGASPFVPAWTTATFASTYAIGTILHAGAANTITGLAAGASGRILVAQGAAAPAWTAPTGTGTPVAATNPGITVNDYSIIPIGYAIDGVSAPAAKSSLTSTYSVDIRNFDPSADEDLIIPWQVPADFSGTTISFRVITFVTNATGPSNEGVAFFLQGASLGDGDILSSTHGTAVKSSWTGKTEVRYDRIATSWSAAVTITNIIAGETAILKLYRDVSDADDTYVQDIGVAFIEIKYQKTTS